MFSLSGKKVLITGATSGIGKSTAILASNLGASVVLVGRNSTELESTKSLLENGAHISHIIDFSSAELELSLKQMFSQVGKVDGVFHCAGMHVATPLKVQNLNDLQALYSVNVFSAVTLIKELRKRQNHNDGCSVVLMSSSSALIGEAAISAYASSKAAIVGLTKSLAAELAKDNIRVNCISAGIVKTRMTQNMFNKLDSSLVSEIERRHILGFGEPDDVANAALFLLSENSKWVTGTNLVVDGGYTGVK